MALRVLMLGVAASVVLVAGCSTKEAGSPSGPPTSGTGKQTGSPSTSSGSGGGSAPRVRSPLDASRFVGQPCTAIAPDELRALNLPTEGKPDTDSQGAGCLWFDRDSGSGVEVDFLTSNKNGLADTYRLNEQGRFKGYFEPTQVDGYPAVFNDISDYRSNGTCNMTVGISDTLAFRTAVQDTKLGQRSCDRAKQAASAVIKTLKGA